MRSLTSARSGHLADSQYNGTSLKAYVPSELPPSPAVSLGPEDEELTARANQAIGRLEGIRTVLPTPRLFTYFYIRKEAVLSAQIEGTQSSLSDFLRFESGATPGGPLTDVEEVSDYIAAMQLGLAALSRGKAIDVELIQNVHWTLMKTGRGSHLAPGKLRTEQNWVGGASPMLAEYVPPPADLVPELLESLCSYVSRAKAPTLLKAAFAHAQFETIHPFFDGNGRLGRLLITLILQADQVMTEPILYLSLYFKQHRAEYYECLQRVRFEGDWEYWVRFFMRGVLEVSNQAVDTAKALIALVEGDRARIRDELKMSSSSALRVLDALSKRPITSAKDLAKESAVSIPTALSTLSALREKGIVAELTGRKKNMLFAYSAYVEVLNRGTELPVANDPRLRAAGATVSGATRGTTES
ncbi:MAG TPA: Fic family protein [Polyangiaceae bacterium]|nr:Fic family protein [Polyangiaceae bacterium]